MTVQILLEASGLRELLGSVGWHYFIFLIEGLWRVN